MSLIGIVANPASGKDIRRLVAYSSVFDNQEKIRIVRRVLLGLKATGIEHVAFMPDYHGIVEKAMEGVEEEFTAERLQFNAKADQRDSIKAAQLLSEQGASCIITLGGDGTNRVVAIGANQVPILPLSTGTNNVFPYMIEGTVAGLAAGLIGTGKVSKKEGTFQSTRLEVIIENKVVDIAVVDAVVSTDLFVGSRAIWEMDKLKQIFLNRSHPANIGFSSIGGMLNAVSPDEPRGMTLKLGKKGRCVTAPIAPGIVEQVLIEDMNLMRPDENMDITVTPCVVALDGEREVEIKKGQKAAIRLSTNGPFVVDVYQTMAVAMEKKIFQAGSITNAID
ncbi:ATP-NAD kinase family protein [Desulfotignum phosphitoxidans]|uniref:Acetoin catabolism protein X, ATP-NAD kinase AcoX n=1 Tax=Desulfotignum phosphitoxidans DSM 13687 TaxID=1286635 RepID=S0G7U4_9BACT|nr:NAD(+)/NADH kinase [Desulfotignum phosphitoxidans]EMS81482.1 acetoin catabolism protein X, ATP-NAD kinase AcoX [Desulfotignum phosphitoxidans DSM 13687]